LFKEEKMSEQDHTRAIFAVNSAYVLAGGQSRRMGRDKLFLSIDGSPLLEKTLAVCSERFNTVKILARENEKFAKFSVPVILDYENAQGPIAGIIAALEDCSDNYCFITAADLCDLNDEIISLLLDNFQGEEYFGIDEGAQKQPLCGIYSVAALNVLRDCADKNIFDLQSALKQINARFIPAPLENWRNINSAADLTHTLRDA
jgi:molybdopterin-guanine dinucleotide biosynthesis protein A